MLTIISEFTQDKRFKTIDRYNLAFDTGNSNFQCFDRVNLKLWDASASSSQVSYEGK